jgi:hypothetical protein
MLVLVGGLAGISLLESGQDLLHFERCHSGVNVLTYYYYGSQETAADAGYPVQAEFSIVSDVTHFYPQFSFQSV